MESIGKKFTCHEREDRSIVNYGKRSKEHEETVVRIRAVW